MIAIGQVYYGQYAALSASDAIPQSPGTGQTASFTLQGSATQSFNLAGYATQSFDLAGSATQSFTLDGG